MINYQKNFLVDGFFFFVLIKVNYYSQLSIVVIDFR